MGSSNLPSTTLSQSSDFSQVIFQKREKNGRNPRFPACHCFSSRRKTTGWFWIPVLIIIIDSTGAESAKHLHNLVRQHLRLPVRLQRGNPLPVHLLRFTNTLVSSIFKEKIVISGGLKN